MPRALTIEQVQERLDPRGIDVLHWQGTSRPARYRCRKDGYVWEATGTSTMRGNGCPLCSGKAKLTAALAAKKLEGRDIEIVEWRGRNTQCRFRCLKDGHVWEAIGKLVVVRGTRCPACTGQVPLTYEEVKRRMDAKNIDVLEWAGTTRKKSLLRCRVDGYEWRSTGTNFLAPGYGCPSCSGVAQLSIEEAAKRLPAGIEILEWRGTGNKGLFRCKTCSYEFQTQGGKVTGCAACAEYGFNPTKPAKLYYARINRFNQNPLYMIGITNRTFADRYKPADKQHMDLLWEKHFEVGADAYAEEQRIIAEFALYIAREGNPLATKVTGSKEIFSRDVLAADTQTIF